MTAITTRQVPGERGHLRDTTDGWRGRGITPGSGWPTPAHHPERAVALIGTYPPTHCGLATFTSNLRAAIADDSPGWAARVVRVLDHEEPERSPEVIAHWLTGDRQSLARALEALSSFDAVLLQHEYGLFGGADGEEVIHLVRGLRSPLIAVLHTALRTPTPHQRDVLERVIDAAAVVVVQSEAARQRILDVHGTRSDKVVVIPHGAAANFEGPVRRDIARPAILTWGLLGPGKGIEEGIDAISQLRQRGAPPSYYVAGQTHPKVRAAQGEDYRETLRQRARSLGVADRVHFDNCYHDWDSLRTLVRSVDVVLLPYHSREQVSSGVLVEAVASAKPIVSTRFPHAEELLADGAGLLVDHGDVDAMAEALHRVLYEPGLAARMSAAVRKKAQPLLWPAVGASYRALIDQVVEAQAAA
jgi:glycosyltransferase involved in cell wall biosynthesis